MLFRHGRMGFGDAETR
jgi:hypothetical protein